MINKIKRPLSIVLVVMMVVSLFTIVPISASAAEETSTVTWNSFTASGGMSSGGVTLTTTQDNTRVGNNFYNGRGSATFTAPEGSVFTKIEFKNCTVVESLNFPGATVAQSGGYWENTWDDEDPQKWVPYYTVTWTGESSEVTFSAIIYGIQSIVFTLAPAPTGYTVTWKNGETVLETDGNVAEGTIPEYNGDTPVKDEDETYTYTFSGWTDGTNTYGATDTLPAVTGDVTYTATFTASAKYTYELDGDNATITGYNGTDQALTIPSEIDGHPVVTIGAKAFRQNETITSVVIPDTVTYVEYSAFLQCPNLTSVTLPDSLETIGGYAFGHCDELTGLVIPDSVTHIGDYAFEYCPKLTTLVIGKSVEFIGENAFEGCTTLNNVVLPDSLKTMEEFAFYECMALEEINIPAGITNIARFTFFGCEKLEAVNFARPTSEQTLSFAANVFTKGDDYVPIGTVLRYSGEGNYALFDGDAMVAEGTELSTLANKTLTWRPAYIVTWKNWDGSVIKTDAVAPNVTPVYGGETPVKDEDETNTYTFSGWSPEVTAVTGNVEYTATFTATPKRTPADDVKDLINALPATVTVNDKEQIEAARAAYNALSDDEKAKIDTDTLSKLTDAETALSAAEKAAADQAAADPVIDQINALPAEVTLNNKAAVEAARQAFNDLTDDQQALVSTETIDKLIAAEIAISNLEAAKAVTDQINNLPDVVTLDDKAAVEAARQAYDELTDDQKNLVTDETLNKLAAAETVIANREGAKGVEDMINALPDAKDITLADKDAVNAANEARLNLPPEQADYLTFAAIGKLFQAMDKIEDLEAAKAVTDQINALPSVVLLDNKAEVEAARQAYNDLTDAQQALVDEEALDKLIAAETVIADREAAKAVDDMVNALPETITLEDKAAVEAADAALENLTIAQAEYVVLSTYGKLADAKKAIANLEAAKAVTDQINALPAEITLDDKAAVEAARQAYNDLTDDQRALVDVDALTEKLTAAEAALKVVLDNAAADAVIAQIGALPAATRVTINDKDAIDGAKAAYDALTDDQKKLVPLGDKLKLASDLIALAIAEKDAADQAAADAVEDEIRALPGVANVTINDKDAIEKAAADYDALTDDQKKLVSLVDRTKLAAVKGVLAGILDEAAANAVDEMINALPNAADVTIDDKAAIEEASAAYDALTNGQKKLVTLANRTKLAAVKGALAAAEDRAAAEAVDAVIKALPDPADVTLDDKAAIEDAGAAYDALTTTQKLLVPLASTDKLQADKDAVDKIESDIAAAQAVADQINALPAAEDVALESAYEIAGARAAYNALTEDQKNLIDDETLNKLTAAEAALQSLVDVDIVERMINALPDAENVTYNDKAAIEDARAAYDALTDDQKALVNPETVDKLTAAEEALAPILEDVAAAQAVSDEIKALPAATKVTVADKAAIDEANDAYNALTDAQKSYVPLADKVKLAAVKGALDAAEKAAEDEDAAAAVEDMIRALPNAGAVTLDDKAAIEDARAAYDALTPDQKRFVNLSDRIKLLADEAAIAKIEGDIAAAQAVTEQINALPAAEDVTLDDGRAIMSASTAYNALTPAQKALVDDEVAHKLTDDVNALNDLAAAEVAKAFINALPNAEDVTIDDKPVIEAVRAVYDNLTDEQKALVDDETYKKLTDAEDALQKIQEDIAVAQAVTNMINALPAAEDVTLDDKDAIEHARAIYDDITDDQKALIDEETYKKLTDAEEALEKAAILYGDANSDGVVDILDAARVQKAANERVTLTDEQIRCSDVNGDGAVDILDATLIQMFTSGTIDKFPVENA